MMLRQTLTPAAIALLLTTGAMAQFTGPSDVAQAQSRQYPPTTVQDIKADPKDEMKATLEGRILRKVADEEYLFSDDTGEIRVEIDDDDVPRQPVSETTRVRLEGEVDTHRYKEVDFDVDRMTILP